ncbi:DTW domain-containing protein 2-like [Anneissia japonica]|uniref:DTW domain-containing protein 2-like n=1 Tax=Anneissia japonica TaxID=1529436 RepID=UPI001425B49C|nr:DTW domain-containing protein 2-like [Anneissia japonica]
MDTLADSVSSENDEESFDEVLDEFSALPSSPVPKRKICDNCSRPTKVCICAAFPKERLKISTNVIIIQHPSEESKVLRTVPILSCCLQEDKCKVIIGRNFSSSRYTELASICSDENSLLLFPGADAVDIEEIPVGNGMAHYNLILLDGTWPQAKGLYAKNKMLHSIKKVQLKDVGLSEYVIRTQPTKMSLSTCESTAIALSILEENEEIREILVKPLRVLCNYQLQHGAVAHHHKEDPELPGIKMKYKNRFKNR